MPPASRTIIVAGAGIGGLTAAIALADRGFRVVVLEQATVLEATGAGIQLSPNASRVLIGLGAAPRLEAVTVTPEAAYEATMTLVTKRKWRVVNARAPQPGRRDGYIEAIAQTPIMAFREDVAIRIRPVGSGARIDMRSASRYGRIDFGVNAARIRTLLEEIDDLTSVTKPERPAPKPAQPAKGGQAAKR